MPRRKNTPPEAAVDRTLPLLPDDPPRRRAVPPFGTCRPDTTSFELYRVTVNDDGTEHHEALTNPGGPDGTDLREWPIEECSAELLAPHGPGIYRARWYGTRPDGGRTPLGMSQKVTRSAASAATAAPARTEARAPAAPTHSTPIDLAAIVAAAEARAESRARTMLDFVLAQNAAKEKQQSDFFAAMMELQTRAHAQQMEAMSRARAPAPAAAAAPTMTPELARIQAELAVMRDRQRRGAPLDDADDDADDPAMRILESPVVAEIAKALAARFLDTPAAPAAATPAVAEADDATEGDDATPE